MADADGKQRHVIDDTNVGRLVVHTWPNRHVRLDVEEVGPMLIRQSYLTGSPVRVELVPNTAIERMVSTVREDLARRKSVQSHKGNA